MENSENPMGTNRINNLAALKYFHITMLRLPQHKRLLKNIYALHLVHYICFLQQSN